MSERSVYVVTGGAGFIGSNLVAALLRHDRDADILVIDDCRTGTYANITAACDRAQVAPFSGRFIAQPLETVDMDRLVRGAKAVFHQAAITDTMIADEAEMIRVNVGGFETLLGACVKASVPLVYASSAATYGTPPQAAQRKAFPLEAAGRATNVYGMSKWLMECRHADAARANRTDRPPWVVGLRYFNVFGPGESRKGHMASMVHQLAVQMLAGEPPRLFRDGTHSRDQVYVDDAVACTLAAAGIGGNGRPRPGVYNVGCGVATSFNQIVASLREELGVPESERATEYFDMPDHVRSFYQDFTLADLSATTAGLGWAPSWKPGDAIRAYARVLKAR